MPGLNKRASNQTKTTSTKMEDINEKEKVTMFCTNPSAGRCVVPDIGGLRCEAVFRHACIGYRLRGKRALPVKAMNAKRVDENPYMAKSDANIHHDGYNTDSTDEVAYLPEMPYREVDLDKAARNVLTQEQFEQDGGDGTVASWRNTVTVENVHPNTTVSFRMKNLSGNTADLKLYAYGADGKLAEVSKELWTITDEAGTGVDTLADGTLYELRVSIADGGALDLSEEEKKIIISVVLAK